MRKKSLEGALSSVRDGKVCWTLNLPAYQSHNPIKWMMSLGKENLSIFLSSLPRAPKLPLNWPFDEIRFTFMYNCLFTSSLKECRWVNDLDTLVKIMVKPKE